MEAELIISLLTLTLLEVVLGIDNVIFIALLVQKLPQALARKARLIGLSLALGMRVIFLLMVSWIIGLTEPLFGFNITDTVNGLVEISGKDLMFFFGGLFLIYKVTKEIVEEMSAHEHHKNFQAKKGFISAIIQIVIIDLVFSFDSVITAVGLTTHIPVIIAAMTIAMIVMLFSSEWIAGFIRKNPTIKMLALGFILLIGVYLVLEAFKEETIRNWGFEFDKNYIYFAMGFSVFIETLCIIARKRKAGTKKPFKNLVTKKV